MEAGREKEQMESVKDIHQTIQEFPALSLRVLCTAFGIPRSRASAAEVAAFSAAVSRLSEPCDRMECEYPAGVLRLRLASCYIPDHDEDAHFGHADAGVVGVADGVGGWRNQGVDAAAFSRALMSSALADVIALHPRESLHSKTLLERAYASAATACTPGASTACILSLSDNTLKWAYVGDSGFAVFREGQIIYRSTVQQSHFNCPLQLATGGGTSVQAAEVGALKVEEGDIVVAGTDGLFDNMFDHELAQAVKVGMALGFSPKDMADVIAGLAYEMSMTREKDSPFAEASRSKLSMESEHHIGGKKDDITVVVAFIQT